MKNSAMHAMFKTRASGPETLMDRISRAAREIVSDESDQRADKTARLRKARLEREACKPAEAAARPRKKAPREKDKATSAK